MGLARLPAAEVSAARQVPIASVVAPVVPLNRQGFGLCPFHEERTPSFHIHPKRNFFKCFGCGAGGDPIAFVQLTQRVDFCSAVQILLCGATLKPDREVTLFVTGNEPRAHDDAIQYVHGMWNTADAPEVAEFYLASRGIRVRPKLLPPAVRGTRRCWCAEAKRYRSALLAGVTEGDDIVAVHRIWTESRYDSNEPTGAKAKLDRPKKTIGRMGHGAVQLYPPQEAMAIAEGVETAMSAAILFRLPVWAALGAQRMGSIALPEVVRQVVVFGDNGEAGEKAAHAAVSAYRRRRYVSEAVFPGQQFDDFNDQLNRR